MSEAKEKKRELTACQTSGIVKTLSMKVHGTVRLNPSQQLIRAVTMRLLTGLDF